MKPYLSVIVLLCTAGLAFAQAPSDDSLQRAQRKAGTAYSELQKIEFERKQAEQEHAQAHASHKAAQIRADELKVQAEAAHKKLETVNAREAAARKTYDAAVEAVDKIPNPAPAK